MTISEESEGARVILQNAIAARAAALAVREASDVVVNIADHACDVAWEAFNAAKNKTNSKGKKS
jgi:hypothetical protein